MKQIILTILFITILAVGLLFFVKNNQPVTLDYILGNVELPLPFMLLICLFTGALLGILATVPLIFRLRLERSRLEKKVRNVEKEINNLRALPVQHSH